MHPATLALPAALTQHTTPAQTAPLLRALDALLAPGPQPSSPAPVVVDASALHEFDSAALALLLALRRHALAQPSPRSLCVQHAPDGLRALAQVYDVWPLLHPEGNGGRAEMAAGAPAP